MTKKTKNGKNIFTDRFVECLVMNTRDVDGKHHWMGTKNILTQATLLLNERKTLQDMFSLTQEGRCDTENEEVMITSSKLGKVFCESLVFCDDVNLWRSTDVNCLSLKDDLLAISAKVISVPIIGEDIYN